MTRNRFGYGTSGKRNTQPSAHGTYRLPARFCTWPMCVHMVVSQQWSLRVASWWEISMTWPVPAWRACQSAAIVATPACSPAWNAAW